MTKNNDKLREFLIAKELNSTFEFIPSLKEELPKLPILNMYCNTESCNDQNFDGKWANFNEDEKFGTIKSCVVGLFKCRNCLQYIVMVFRLASCVKDNSRYSELEKITHHPTPNNKIIKPVTKFLYGSDDWDLYLNGCKLEENGKGIGAMAYYRRVIENTWSRLIDEIISIVEDSKIIESLEKSKGAWQFQNKIDAAKGQIPESLLIYGENPLDLLYKSASAALHAYNEKDCLERARNIRTVFEKALENISNIKKDSLKLKDAITSLKSKH